jgi:8-amino-3,8-dideoxy-alpha-D-manno-octulosonate transaminase
MPGFEMLGSEEAAQVNEIMENGFVLFRHGFDQKRNGIFKVRDFEQAFAKKMNVDNALAVSSGTAALRVALAGLGIGPGDEVITQAFTFVATVEAIVDAGVQPIIAEVDNSLNMDPADFERKITDKTKAVIVVHMLGIPCDMNPILKIAREKGIKVIEDTAWGCGGQYEDQYLGTIGDIGTYSFDFAKTITTGEGGMVVCKDPVIAEKCRAYHDHGHENNPKLPRWEDSRSGEGFNYRMMEFQGAVGLAQLAKLDDVLLAQNTNKQKLVSVISRFPTLSFRKRSDVKIKETADALIFFVDSNEAAKRYREVFLKYKIGTKILPEAITWHFAGTWNHISSLNAFYPNLAGAFPVSKELLSRAVAIPIMVNMPENIELSLHQALTELNS